MHRLHEFCHDHIDVLLLAAGIFLALVVPLLLLQQAVLAKDWLPVMPLLPLLVSGIACLVVGSKGCFLNAYASIDERREALWRMFLVVSVIGGPLLLALLVAGVTDSLPSFLLSSTAKESSSAPTSVSPTTFMDQYLGLSLPSAFTSYAFNPIRCAIACLGGVGGYGLASIRPPVDPSKAFWYSVLCAAAAWFLAPAIYGILIAVFFAAIAIKFIQPYFPSITNWFRSTPATPPLPPSRANDRRIAELQQQIVWTRNSGAPAQFRNEEIARLNREIQNLGGTP